MFLLTGVSLDSNNDNFLTALSPAKLQVRNNYEYDDIALLESHGKGGRLQDTQYSRYFDFFMKLGRWVDSIGTICMYQSVEGLFRY